MAVMAILTNWQILYSNAKWFPCYFKSEKWQKIFKKVTTALFHCIFAVLPCISHDYTMHLPYFLLVCHVREYALLYFAGLYNANLCFNYALLQFTVLLQWEVFIRETLAEIHRHFCLQLNRKVLKFQQQWAWSMAASVFLSSSVTHRFSAC